MLPPGSLSLGACGGAFFPPRRPSRRAVRPRASGDAAPPEVRPAHEPARESVRCNTLRCTRALARRATLAARHECAIGTTIGVARLTRAPLQPAGEAANKWHDNVLEGAKRLSAEHLPPLREAAKKAVSQAAERVPHSAKAVELGAGLWARLPEPAQKAAPPVAGALGVRPPARSTFPALRIHSKAAVERAYRLTRCARRSRPRARCCFWAP